MSFSCNYSLTEFERSLKKMTENEVCIHKSCHLKGIKVSAIKCLELHVTINGKKKLHLGAGWALQQQSLVCNSRY